MDENGNERSHRNLANHRARPPDCTSGGPPRATARTAAWQMRRPFTGQNSLGFGRSDLVFKAGNLDDREKWLFTLALRGRPTLRFSVHVEVDGSVRSQIDYRLLDLSRH
jgi:hypothetical protein